MVPSCTASTHGRERGNRNVGQITADDREGATIHEEVGFAHRLDEACAHARELSWRQKVPLRSASN